MPIRQPKRSPANSSAVCPKYMFNNLSANTTEVSSNVYHSLSMPRDIVAVRIINASSSNSDDTIPSVRIAHNNQMVQSVFVSCQTCPMRSDVSHPNPRQITPIVVDQHIAGRPNRMRGSPMNLTGVDPAGITGTLHDEYVDNHKFAGVCTVQGIAEPLQTVLLH